MSADDEIIDYGSNSGPFTRRNIIIAAAICSGLVAAGLLVLVIMAPWNHNALEDEYKSTVEEILRLSSESRQGYDDLMKMCNTYGSRITGSSGLDAATEYVYNAMQSYGLLNVQYDNVEVINWVRGDEETLMMTYPYQKKMAIMALGNSIGATDLVGDVIVVQSFDELDTLGNEGKITGKIVVYNKAFTTYGATSSYRTTGARRASAYGAIASLTRSVTPYSLYTPHTGVQYYDDTNPPIPAAAITVEDAILLQYMQDSDITPKLQLSLSCQTLDKAPGRNVLGELPGTGEEGEIVVIGGHIDSWDVGVGAQDDAGGVWQALEAVRILKANNLIPRRTIRVVAWTAEENDGAGAQGYFDQHREDLDKTVFSLESDDGTLTPTYWSFDGSEEAMKIVQDISNLMKPTLNMEVVAGFAGADIEILNEAGVPGVGLEPEGFDECDKMVPSKYFYWHHTDADTTDKVVLKDFQDCVGAIASLVYVIADMEQTLPR